MFLRIWTVFIMIQIKLLLLLLLLLFLLLSMCPLHRRRDHPHGRKPLLMNAHQELVVVASLERRQYQSAVAAAEVEEDVARSEVEEVEGRGLRGGVGGIVGCETIVIGVGGGVGGGIVVGTFRVHFDGRGGWSYVCRCFAPAAVASSRFRETPSPAALKGSRR